MRRLNRCVFCEFMCRNVDCLPSGRATRSGGMAEVTQSVEGKRGEGAQVSFISALVSSLPKPEAGRRFSQKSARKRWRWYRNRDKYIIEATTRTKEQRGQPDYVQHCYICRYLPELTDVNAEDEMKVINRI